MTNTEDNDCEGPSAFDNQTEISEIDLVIGKCVEDIWAKYDDGNGFLDKNETRRFVRDTLADMSDGVGFNDADFN